MHLEAWPWARANLTPDDRAEIAQAEPKTARCLISREGRGGIFRASMTDAVPMTVQQGLGKSPIAAFRDALAKVPA